MVSRSLFPIVCLLFFALSIQAQDPDLRSRNSNAELADLAVADYALIDQLMLRVPGVAADANANLQEQSVKAYMMPVRRSEKSTMFASYMLASCLEYYTNLEKNYKVNLSPDYIALNLQAQGRDLSLIDAFQFLAREGTVSAAIMPYGAGTITNAVYATPKFRILHYLHVIRPVTKDRQKVFELRKALLRGNPILIEVQADASLSKAEGVSQWRSRGQNNSQKHQLIVVGFDENREAFEVMSAWGSRWGRGGYLWVPYDDLAACAQNGYVLVPQ